MHVRIYIKVNFCFGSDNYFIFSCFLTYLTILHQISERYLPREKQFTQLCRSVKTFIVSLMRFREGGIIFYNRVVTFLHINYIQLGF